MNRILRDPLLWLVLAATLGLVLPIAHWGIPRVSADQRAHAWGNDDQIPLAPLAELHNALIEARPDRNVAYPMFHYLLLGASYAPYLGALWLTGDLEHPSGVYPFGLRDPERAFEVLAWIGRSLSILLALACVGGVYWTARTLWDRAAGVFAALTWLLAFPYVYYAPLGNPDGPMLAWTSLGLAASAEVLRNGLTPLRAALLGAFVACAGATKDQAAANFVLVAPVLLGIHFASGASHRWRGFEGRFVGPVIAAASLLAVFVVASGIPLDPRRFLQHAALVFSVGPGTKALYLRHPRSWDGALAQATDLACHLGDVLGVLLLLVVAGLGIAAWRDRRSLTLALSSAGMFGILMPVGMSRIHYLLPVALPLCAFAGLALSARWKQGPRALAAVAIAALLGWHGLRTLDLMHALRHDSRYAASEWLDANARAGDVVLYFGAPYKNPHLRGDVASVGVDPRERGPELLATKPAFVIVQPEDTNQKRERVEWRRGTMSVRNDYVADDVWLGLTSGALGYRLVAQFQTPRLLPWAYRPALSYAVANPPVQIFAREDRAVGGPHLTAWQSAPHNPPVWRVNEPMAK
ncbi:MAG TPA: hypothetical protein VII78_05635 [Myxococcota bacterium]